LSFDITVGSKSGLERTNPVGWFPGPDNSWLIVAAAAGAAKNPSWYYNIAAHPDRVRIEIDHRTISVIAKQLHGAEREQAWEQVIAAQPRFAKYQVRTDRELPIIRLVSRAAPLHIATHDLGRSGVIAFCPWHGAIGHDPRRTFPNGGDATLTIHTAPLTSWFA
jgi:deazaflavin-dependent oxidoreductase (nitroreductase family)